MREHRPVSVPTFRMGVSVAASIVLIAAAILTSACVERTEEPIRLALFKSPAVDAAREIIPEFESETGLAVEVEVLPYAELQDKVKTEFLTRSPRYDIVMADCIWIPEFAASGYLQPIDSYLRNPDVVSDDWAPEDIIPSVADYLGKYPANGATYGVPFMTNSQVLAYRQDLFDEYLRPEGIREPGRTLDDAWTWEEYLKAAELLTREDPSVPGGKLWGSSMQARAGAWLVYEWYAWLFGAGGRDIDYGAMEPRFSEPNSVLGIRRYASLVGHIAPETVLSWGHEEETQALASGQCAMDATWNVELVGYLVDPEHSKHALDFSFALSPRGATGTPTPDMGGYGLLLSAFSKRPEESVRLMTWLTSPAVHKRIVLRGGSPFRYSVMSAPEVLAKYPVYEIYGLTLEHSVYRARVPNWNEIQDSISKHVSAVMLGEASAEAAAESIQASVSRALATD